MFTEKETKLIRLAMDGAAHPGERDNCASMLIQSLLKRGIDSEKFINLSGPRVYEPHKEKKQYQYHTNGKHVCPHCQGPDWGTYIMPQGKHQGKMLRDIPLDYLQYARHTWDDKKRITDSIDRFFNQYFRE